MDFYVIIVNLLYKKINEKIKFVLILLFVELYCLVFFVNFIIIIINVKKIDVIFGFDFSKIE